MAAFLALVFLIPLDALANPPHHGPPPHGHHHPPPPPPKTRLEKRCSKGYYEQVWVEPSCEMVRHKRVCRAGYNKRVWRPGHCEMVEVPVRHRR
ncbi:MAG: hypothetical protein FWC28_05375 [Proteobacteria bacterium]|nr:hypothetical protein [Cystobacterineae bacterium]MCL2258980.1 hypothetical protein [Cystobacterineae bacterium]MCL2314666.1 hypothetical protein [Pseudomonadota bacterium]